MNTFVLCSAVTILYFWDHLEADGDPVTEASLHGRTFAIDLSIWIVEARTAVALGRQHANPHLFLVVTRAVFLMKRGARVVAVLEGARSPLKQRVRRRVRCSASDFERWTDDCGAVLRALGVPCLRAPAGTEAEVRVTCRENARHPRSVSLLATCRRVGEDNTCAV